MSAFNIFRHSNVGALLAKPAQKIQGHEVSSRLQRSRVRQATPQQSLAPIDNKWGSCAAICQFGHNNNNNNNNNNNRNIPPHLVMQTRPIRHISNTFVTVHVTVTI
jgi:hypothetical protein